MTLGNDPSLSASDDSIEGNRPHKPADDREEVYFAGSPMLRGEVGRLLITFLIAAGLIVIAILAWSFQWWPMMWPNVVLIVLAILVLVVPFILVRTVRYRISNYRVDFERGLLSRTIDTLELWHVEDIKFHQSLIDRMMGVGTVTIISHDETTPRLVMRGLPNARSLFDSLKQRVIAVKRQRGVIKMDVG